MVYRDADEALRRRRDELLAARLRELQGLPSEVTAVYARRHARRAAGIVGIGGAAVLGLAALARAPGLTVILQATWLALLVTYVGVHMVTRMSVRRLLWRTFVPTD